MPRAAICLVAGLLLASGCGGSGIRPMPGKSASIGGGSPSGPAPSGSPSPSFSPRTGRLVLAYACGRFICRSAPNGKEVRTLTGGARANDRHPSWSPDGSRIAFSRTSAAAKGDIYVMTADGSKLQDVASGPSNDTEPSWSPDGARIAFVSDRDGNLEVYVMNVDGTNVRDLSKNPARDSDPSWTPDGQRVVFTSTRDGKPEVYVAELEDRERPDSRSAQAPPQPAGRRTAPGWSWWLSGWGWPWST